ncbi:MAG: hypothetical protein ACETWK_03665 [Candidatus Aminicenantaceae bacterium]
MHILTLKHFFKILRRFNRIGELAEDRTLTELVEAVKDEYRKLAIPGSDSIKIVLKYWPLWRLLHRGVRQHPCLYFAMLAYASETAAGRPVEINIGLYRNGLNEIKGHCWVTREGKKLYGNFGPSPSEYKHYLGKKDHIVFWWLKEKKERNLSSLKEDFIRTWSKKWRT